MEKLAFKVAELLEKQLLITNKRQITIQSGTEGNKINQR